MTILFNFWYPKTMEIFYRVNLFRSPKNRADNICLIDESGTDSFIYNLT